MPRDEPLPSLRRDILFLLFFAACGAVAACLSSRIPGTELNFEARWAFGYLGVVLIRRRWPVFVLLALLSMAGVHHVPFHVALIGNMYYTVPSVMVLRYIHDYHLHRVRHPAIMGGCWFLSVFMVYMVFHLPLVYEIRAILNDRPVIETILEGYTSPALYLEAVLVGVMSGMGLVIWRVLQTSRHNEQHLAVTLNSIGDAVVTTDANGRVDRMNPVAEDLTGWSETEACGRKLEEVFVIVNAVTGDPVDNPVRRVLEEGVTVGLANDTTLLRRDGTGRQIADSAAPIRIGDGALQGVVMVFRDVTEQYEARRRLRESEARYREIANSVPGMVYVLERSADGELSFSFVSGGARELLGVDPEEMRRDASTLFDRIPEEDMATVRALAEASGETMTMYAHTHRIRDASDEMRWVNTRATPHAREDGGVYWNGVVIDVTDLKRAEDAVRDSEERFRGVFESNPAGIALVDTETQRFLRANHSFLDIVGYDEEELLMRTVMDVTHPEDWKTESSMVRDRLDGAAEAFSLEKRYVRKDGAVRWVRVTGDVLERDDGPPVAIACAEDITDEREMETRMRQMEKMEAVGQLAGGVAHDFNNQLSGVMGYADMLLARLDDEKLRKYADNILVSARRAADLTQQLLAFSRKSANREVLVDLHDIINEVTDILEHSIDRRIVVKRHLDASPATTRGDPSQLQNALLNLGLNARDAMPDGGELRFETSIRELDQVYCLRVPYDLQPGTYVRIAVQDTGCGMSESVRARVFEPFFTTKEQGKGTGMGLAAVYGTVKQHGGAVNVYSEPGSGTSFTLYFPLSGKRSTEVIRRRTDVSRLKGKRILVIDDEEVLRNMVADMLSVLGCEVTAEADGEAGVARFREDPEKYDAIVLDMIMPRMSGRDAFAAIRETDPEACVLLASGYSARGEAAELLAAGAAGFLQKPFQSGELTSALVTALDPTAATADPEGDPAADRPLPE